MKEATWSSKRDLWANLNWVIFHVLSSENEEKTVKGRLLLLLSTLSNIYSNQCVLEDLIIVCSPSPPHWKKRKTNEEKMDEHDEYKYMKMWDTEEMKEERREANKKERRW